MAFAHAELDGSAGTIPPATKQETAACASSPEALARELRRTSSVAKRAQSAEDDDVAGAV